MVGISLALASVSDQRGHEVNTCTVMACGNPGLNGLPGRDGRDGSKGEKGEPGIGMAIFVCSINCRVITGAV